MKNIHTTITHIDIPAPEFQKAILFYSNVFMWDITVAVENQYAFFRIGHTNTGGGLDAALQPAQESHGPQVCIDVDDIEDTLQQIVSNGGKIVKPKTEIGDNHGHYACFQDVNNNYLQIHSNSPV